MRRNVGPAAVTEQAVFGDSEVLHPESATGHGRGWKAESAAALIPAIVAGVVIGTIEVAFATTFAALIFTGPLSVHLPSAIGLSLFGATVIMAVLALFSTLPGTVGSVQDVPAAILAVGAAAVAAQLPADAPDTFITIALAIALSSLLVGLFFLLLGVLRLGNLVRFVPYPVVGGFLAGTGVLLVQGSFGVLTGSSLTFQNLPGLFQASSYARWLPALAFAVLLLFLVRRGGHFMVIPGLFVAVIPIFYLVMLAAGIGVAEAEAQGWLLGPFPDGALWRPPVLSALGTADWSALSSQGANVAIMAVLSALALLLNATGMELALRSEVDLDRELRAAGAANVVGAVGGGFPGYQTPSLTALAHQMGGASRAVGMVAAVTCAGAFTAGAGILSLIPRAAIGGLLLFIGLTFVVEWVYDTWFSLPRAEYLLLLVIVTVIVGWGFAIGVLVGLIAAIALFLYNYSRIDVVKHALTARTYQSNVDRPTIHREYLEERGDHIEIIKLHGFLFFGTANSVFERVRSRVSDDSRPKVRFLVLDFRRTTGLDSSASLSFRKICILAEAEGFIIVMTSLMESLRQTLEHAGLSEEHQPALRTFGDIDYGVQWCEDRLLEEGTRSRILEADHHGSADWEGTDSGLDISRLRPYLEHLTIAQGDVLIRQGESSGDLFFLNSGRLTAQLDGDYDDEAVRLRSVGAGTVVGELTLYLGTPRSATVVAERECDVYRLSRGDVEKLEACDPELAASLHRWLAGLMARRLVNSVRTISALLD